MIRITFFILAILWSVKSVMAYQFVVESDPKPSIEVNIGAIYNFQRDMLELKEIEASKIKKKDAIKVSKSQKKPKDVENKSLFVKSASDPAPESRQEDKSKKSLLGNEVKLKQQEGSAIGLANTFNKDRKNIERDTKTHKKEEHASSDREEQSVFAIAKSSRATNLLQKVEKSLLKNRLKTKEYPVEYGVKQVNLLHENKITTKSLKPALISNNSNLDHEQKFVISFSGANTDISSNMNDDLNKIVSFLNSDKNKRVRIVGHSSDKIKDIAVKRRYALERVVSVRKYLVDRGVNTRQISLQAAAGRSSSSKANSDIVEILEIR